MGRGYTDVAMEGCIIRGKGGWDDCILPFPINVQDYMMEWAACTRKLIIDPTALLAKKPYVQGHSCSITSNSKKLVILFISKGLVTINCNVPVQ